MRVIAGSAGGRQLKPPPTERIRPTGDKVKGAIFSLLEAEAYRRGFDQADEDDDRFAAARAWPRVLDLYAGSGALGIEALSRGARSVDFVDSNARARRLIAENLGLLGLAERATVPTIAAEQAVSTLVGSYDLILADPPYTDGGAARTLAGIADSPLLADHSVFIWEHSSDLAPPPRLGRLVLDRTRRHGLTAISLYTAESDPSDRERGADPEQPSP